MHIISLLNNHTPYRDTLQSSKRIRSVRFVSRSLNHITELMHENFDIIINCSGLGAGKLVDDADVHPIRGELLNCVDPIKIIVFSYGRSGLNIVN